MSTISYKTVGKPQITWFLGNNQEWVKRYFSTNSVDAVWQERINVLHGCISLNYMCQPLINQIMKTCIYIYM